MNDIKYSFMFHDIYELYPEESGFPDKSSNSFKISQEDFILFLEHLKIKCIKLGINIYDIILTFDDGGSSSIWVAEELSKRDLKGYFFISTNFIGKDGFCTKEDIKEIDRMGHYIGNHSHSHPSRISKLRGKSLIDEWTVSNSILQEILKKKIVNACFPGGHYSLEQVMILRDLGYKKVFTIKPSKQIIEKYGVQIIGRFPIRSYTHIKKSLRYLKRYSFFCMTIKLRWNLLTVVKYMSGRYFDLLRDIIKQY